MTWIGDYPEDFTTVAVYFTTHDGNGAPVAPSTAFEAADVIIYKNGSATQKTSTNGITMTSPFDSITGLHSVLIDTSNDTGDAAFWVAGAVYTVVLSPDETVNSQAVAKVLATFGLSLTADSVLDEVVDGTRTFRQLIRGWTAVLLGKASGLPTAPKYRNIADSKNVIDATTDTDGNRTAVTLDLT